MNKQNITPESTVKIANGEKVKVIGVHKYMFTAKRKNNEKCCVGLDDMKIIKGAPIRKEINIF